MSKFIFLFCIIYVALITSCTTTETVQESVFENFVTSSGGKLMDGTNEIKFVSFNIPCLHYNEDNMPFDEINPWRLPDEFEITDALESVRQMGGTAVRIYTLSVRKEGEDESVPRHVLAPGEFNEEAFRALDKVLEVANKTGVRVIIPFVDNWEWWGGTAEYAAFKGKIHNIRDNNSSDKAFWNDPEVIEDFKKTIDFVINRTNSYTGVPYKEDKAILAWETGNELLCPPEWTALIAEYIKSLDANHLLIDGYHTNVLRDDSISNPNIDIVTSHHYEGDPGQIIVNINANLEKVNGTKPYFVGEIGFISTDGFREVLDKVIESGMSGALVWSLRYRNRDGGFYWHSEPHGSDVYKAYHWPGYATGAEYDETNLLNLLRAKAFEIRGMLVPPTEMPKAPFLLPIEDAAAISWRGSVGAGKYDVERAEAQNGPWTVVGSDISDTAVQYRPLFNDASVEVDKQYYYRVKAKNSAGVSPPSNIVGPVTAQYVAIVDELQDFSQIRAHEGDFSLVATAARSTKEDMHRLAGNTGSSITYQTDGPVESVKLFTFFPDDITDFQITVSSDGNNFTGITAERSDYFATEGSYNYYKPVQYEAGNVPDNIRYVKIDFAGKAEISRIEIYYHN